MFDNVPLSNYVICVKDSKNFMGNEKSLDVIGEQVVQPSFNIFIEIKPQVYSFTEIRLQNEEEQNISKATVTALLLSNKESIAVARTLLFLPLDYLSDLYETSDGLYSATLVPGEYIINAEANNYKELSVYFVSKKGECVETLKLEKKSPSTLTMTATDIIKESPITGTLVKLSTLAKGMNVENVTDTEGRVTYKTDGCGYYKMFVSRENYVSYTKELCISKESASDIVIPLIPISKKFGMQICLSGEYDMGDLSLKIYCPNTQEDDEILGNKESSVLEGKARIVNNSIGALALLTNDVNEWFRVCVELTGNRFTFVDKKKLDKYLQNSLQSANVIIYIVVNESVKYAVQPPLNIAGSVWDVGFVNPLSGELLAINAITNISPGNRLENHKEFLNLYSYISAKSDVRTSFGFSKSGVQRLDDIIMSQEEFGKVVENLHKESSEEFKEKLVNSVSDMFGNVSLKQLMKLINLNKGQSSDMEGTRTLRSTTTANNKKLNFGFLKGYTYKEPVDPKKEAPAKDRENEFDNEEPIGEKSKPGYGYKRQDHVAYERPEEFKKSFHSDKEESDKTSPKEDSDEQPKESNIEVEQYKSDQDNNVQDKDKEDSNKDKENTDRHEESINISKGDIENDKDENDKEDLDKNHEEEEVNKEDSDKEKEESNSEKDSKKDNLETAQHRPDEEEIENNNENKEEKDEEEEERDLKVENESNEQDQAEEDKESSNDDVLDDLMQGGAIRRISKKGRGDRRLKDKSKDV